MSDYKANNFDAEDSRMRRLEDAAELRKMKKEYQFFKRRDIKYEDLSSLDEADTEPAKQLTLDEIVAAVNCSNRKRQLAGMKQTRQMLGCDNNPPIDLIVRHGLVPIFVRFLQDTSNVRLQIEAACALTNIAAGSSDNTQCVIDHGAVPHLVSLLQSESLDLVKQAVWALGNIAGAGDVTRDIVIQHNVVDALLPLISDDQPLSLLRTVVWLMANLCRYQITPPSFDQMKRMLPVLSQLLLCTDFEMLADVCWAFSYMTEIDDNIPAIVEAGTLPRIVNLLEANEYFVGLPALRIIGNIIAISDEQTESIIAAGGLNKLALLLDHADSNIVEEALWIVSNITADSQWQIQAVMDSGILHQVCDLMETGVFKAQREAAWTITNIILSGSTDQITNLLKGYSILKPFVNLLAATDVSTIKVVMSGLENLLELADRLGSSHNLCQNVEELGGLEKFEALQHHENEEIYKEAVAIMEKYFNYGEDRSESDAPSHA